MHCCKFESLFPAKYEQYELFKIAPNCQDKKIWVAGEIVIFLGKLLIS